MRISFNQSSYDNCFLDRLLLRNFLQKRDNNSPSTTDVHIHIEKGVKEKAIDDHFNKTFPFVRDYG